MKIGIDARMYGVQATTGIGAYIKNLTDEIFKLDQVNHYVLLMKDPEYSNFNPPNSRVTKIKVAVPWYSLAEQLKLPKILSQAHLDLVHFPHFNVPILYQGNYVVTIHDITPKLFPGPKVKKSWLRKLAYQLVFSQGINRAKTVIAISNHTKQNLAKYFKVDMAKVVVTPLGLNQNFNQAISAGAISQLKLKYKITKPFLFYVGVWRDHKNLSGLIGAFNLLKTNYNLDYQLVLGGKPDPRYPEITQAINNSPFKADIITPGFISDQELPVFYQAAKLFVLPSFCEGFGLVALEAQSTGLPVVASNTTSLPEVLEDSAIYFDPNNHTQIAEVINRVLTNQALYLDLKTRGLNQVKKYRWDKTAQQTLVVYQNR